MPMLLLCLSDHESGNPIYVLPEAIERIEIDDNAVTVIVTRNGDGFCVREHIDAVLSVLGATVILADDDEDDELDAEDTGGDD